MQNKPYNLGPVILSATLTTNAMNPPTLTGGVAPGATKTYILLRHIRISNKTGFAATFSLWKGATGANAAGTEFIGTAISIAANSAMDFFGYWYFTTADFLVGGAGTGSALTLTGDGEIGVAD